MPDTYLNRRYRLEDELGRGGMGIVYRGHDTLLDREVAVKVLSGAELGETAQRRLLAEAQAAASLNHPNIVAVYDAGEDEGRAFIVMELVEGESLYEHRPQGLDEILAVARQICAALEHAHSHGLVHRDLKPENVLMATFDTVKLADLGLARHPASRLSVEGGLSGTAFYLAPESALGHEVDGRADLYSLGVMLYELVAGRLPFTGDDLLAVISQHLHASVVPPSSHRPDLPPALEAVILRLLAKNPADRYASAGEVARALEQVELAPEAVAPLVPAASLSLLEQLNRGRLIGRRAELGQLRGLWAQARQHQGQLALLSGEPGVGKTRLARELMLYAQLEGATVLQGGCYEYEMAVPYLPFVEALRGWVHGQEDEALRESMSPAAAADLVRLAPEIEARLGPLVPNPPLPPQEERLRLFDHLARLLQKIAGSGLLLFLDDLHWADQGTLLLLRYLLRVLRHDRVLVLAAYREMDLDRSHPLAAALVEWNRERLATRLPLGRLGRPETGDLLAALFGADQVTDEFVEAVYRETEGNPFFVEEVVKALVDQGQIYREEGRWQRLDIAEMSIPQSVKEAIGRRLSRLSDTCLEALYAATPLGKSFAFRELAAVTDRGDDALLDALDEAIAAQLLRAEGGETFVFTHDKIREVLYSELNPVRRRRLHKRTGQALESLYAGELEAHVQDLAYHFVEGGDQPRALHYLRLAAHEASWVYALDEALDHYAQAAELASVLELPQDEAAVHESMAATYVLRGPVDQAVDHYERALALTSSAAERARIKMQIGMVYTDVGDERGAAYLHSALDELDPEVMPNAVARALAALGRLEHYHGRHRRAVEFLEQARRLAEPLDDPVTLADVYAYLAGAFQHLGRYDESFAWARRSIALGERHDLPRATSLGYEFLAENSFGLGLWDETLDYAAREREIGVRTGAQVRVAWCEFSQANAYYGLGELERALTAAAAALTLAESIGDLRLAVLGDMLLAVVRTDLHQDDAARASAERSLARGNELNQLYMLCMGRHALAYYHLQRAEWEPAARLYGECRRLLDETDNVVTWMQIGAYAVQALCGLGWLDQAGDMATDYLSVAAETGSRYFVAMGQQALGQVRAAQGNHREAERHLGEAIDAFRQTGTRLELGRALVHRGRLPRAGGDVSGPTPGPAGARLDRDEAETLFRACGALRDLESVR